MKVNQVRKNQRLLTALLLLVMLTHIQLTTPMCAQIRIYVKQTPMYF